jgi:hypothetical protein
MRGLSAMLPLLSSDMVKDFLHDVVAGIVRELHGRHSSFGRSGRMKRNPVMKGNAMSFHEVMIEGTLKPDGTLELDQKPSLSPGRVTVILQPAQAKTSGQGGLADVIDEIHKGQQARGFQGRSAKEIEEGLREGEDEYEKRMQAL